MFERKQLLVSISTHSVWFFVAEALSNPSFAIHAASK